MSIERNVHNLRDSSEMHGTISITPLHYRKAPTMKNTDIWRDRLIESFEPLPAHLPKNCPDFHPDDFPLVDSHSIPEAYLHTAEEWARRLATGDRDVVLQLAELFWDLTWKAAE
jgi:hypothetical protein